MGKQRKENGSGDLGSQDSFEVKPNVNFLVTMCCGLSRADFLALLPIKHIMLWIFKAGLCLWVFLKRQMLKNSPSFCWILERGPVYLVFPDLFLFHCLQWFRSVSRITPVVNHSTGNILSPTVHSLFLVNVLSTWALFQENCGRESLDGGPSSYRILLQIRSWLLPLQLVLRSP